jgi:hypothetical protein
LRCALRSTRGTRPIREMEDATGINRGTLSLIEVGRLLPTDGQVEPIERAYGLNFEFWYSRAALVAIVEDEAA